MKDLDGTAGLEEKSASFDPSLSPPRLTSERVKSVLSRALLDPASLSPLEVRELAASVLTHIAEFDEFHDKDR